MTAAPAEPAPGFPRNAWYAVAPSHEVGRTPVGRRAVGRSVALYRTLDGAPVALEDRCAHRPYPLSLGRLDGDRIVSGYTGFTYAPDGSCVAVPTQAHVPLGARVRAFPAHDDGALVWIWAGVPDLARLRPVPEVAWLRSPEWATFGQEWETAASLELLQDNFADISHVPVVDPVITPPVLAEGTPPPIEVEVSETSVAFTRSFPPAALAPWHAAALGLPAEARHRQREEGHFVSPGLWVDRWDVEVSGHGRRDGLASFVFTHALTPLNGRATRHLWRVSRNFGLDGATGAALAPLFTEYYRRVRSILETMQDVIDRDGWRPAVNVSADAAGIAVRKIMHRLVDDERRR